MKYEYNFFLSKLISYFLQMFTNTMFVLCWLSFYSIYAHINESVRALHCPVCHGLHPLLILFIVLVCGNERTDVSDNLVNTL